MSQERYQRVVVVKRFPVSFLSDVVYGAQPMSQELAETIRILRRDHRMRYEDIMWYLCESDPSASQCYGFGKALTELACQRLDDFNPDWK